eukprot:Nitzschia sp. Nitz4//scaffold345_size17508//16580//17173//NITZ4_008826-RA/size17508-processed-gene-0.14-mRNA-1//-1//CDS//3329548637//899//frame0
MPLFFSRLHLPHRHSLNAKESNTKEASNSKSPFRHASVNLENAPSEKESHENMKLVMLWIEKLNKHSTEGFRDLVTDDYIVQFAEQEMNIDSFLEECQGVWDAFPDFAYNGKSIEMRDDGVVVAHRFVAKGTHTGKAYGFGPYDPIAPNGAAVENDPETSYFFFKQGKICKQVVSYIDGDMTGPAGLYTQLGGFPLL